MFFLISLLYNLLLHISMIRKSLHHSYSISAKFMTLKFLGGAWCCWVWLLEPEHKYGKTGSLVNISY